MGRPRHVSLDLAPAELRCDITLTNGQAFGWETTGANEWTGVIKRFVVQFRQTPYDTSYAVLNKEMSPGDRAEAHEAVRDYLGLKLCEEREVACLATLYEEWSEADKRFQILGKLFPGVRLLRQDPVECLFSFLCSSNNNISRITKMLTSLRTDYGTPIDVEEEDVAEAEASSGGEESASSSHSSASSSSASPRSTKQRKRRRSAGAEGDVEERPTPAKARYFTFPDVDALSKIEEQTLRDLGFGYRARFIVETARRLKELDDAHLKTSSAPFLPLLRGLPTADIRTELVKFHGVGQKVADCVALFSLDALDAVPVDTHMLQLAVRDYGYENETKTFTTRSYDSVADVFRSRFGPYAGWAHSVLFTAELAVFSSRIPRGALAGISGSGKAKARKSAKLTRGSSSQRNGKAKAKKSAKVSPAGSASHSNGKAKASRTPSKSPKRSPKASPVKDGGGRAKAATSKGVKSPPCDGASPVRKSPRLRKAAKLNTSS